MIDCTYKTNRYNLPLCHITGRTSTGKTFDIGYCLINSEREVVYNMVISHLTKIFTDYLPGKQPSVLVIDKETALKNALRNSEFFGDVPQIICQWHVELNVLTHAQAKWNEKIVRTKTEKEEIRTLRRAFMARFTALLHCSIDNFNDTWAKIIQDYGEDTPQLVEYLRTEWVEAPYKNEVFDCFIDANVRHFGHKCTSTNEGAPAILKKYLQDRTGDLLTVISAAHTKIQGEIHEVRGDMAKDFDRKPDDMKQNPFFDNIIDKVTLYALRKVNQQYAKALTVTREPPPSCTGYYKLNMGLPCSHTIREMHAHGEKLALRDVHPHWYYFRSGDRATEPKIRPTPSALMTIREPAVIKQGRGRPKRDDNSTKRLPSQFELTRGRQVSDRASTLTISAPSPIPLTLPPPTQTTSSLTAVTGTAPAKKRVRGPDKQLRRKKTQTEKGKGRNTAVETVKGAKDAVARQRGLEALREALVDKDIENGDW